MHNTCCSFVILCDVEFLIFLIYSFYILLTIPILVNPSPIPAPFYSERVFPTRCYPLMVLEVSIRQCASSPTEPRYGSPAQRTYST